MVANKFLEELELEPEVHKSCVFICQYFHQSVRKLSERLVPPAHTTATGDHQAPSTLFSSNISYFALLFPLHCSCMQCVHIQHTYVLTYVCICVYVCTYSMRVLHLMCMYVHHVYKRTWGHICMVVCRYAAGTTVSFVATTMSHPPRIWS